MNEKIHRYIDDLFAPYDDAKSAKELKRDLLVDLNDRFDERITRGEDERTALADTLNSIGDIEETLKEMAGLTQTLERQMLVNFSAQDLGGSDFAGVTLHGGKFEASAMKDADFSGADLTGSVFKSSDLRDARFDRANLTGCKFSTLDLRGGRFRESILVRTRFEKTGLDGAIFANLRLVDVVFTMVDMRKVVFDRCSIDGGEFTYVDLEGQHFEGMTLRNVRLGKSTLKGASFQGAVLQNVSFAPPFALTKKYYNAIRTIRFDGASMDKLTYNALKGLGADLSGATAS